MWDMFLAEAMRFLKISVMGVPRRSTLSLQKMASVVYDMLVTFDWRLLNLLLHSLFQHLSERHERIYLLCTERDFREAF